MSERPFLDGIHIGKSEATFIVLSAFTFGLGAFFRNFPDASEFMNFFGFASGGIGAAVAWAFDQDRKPAGEPGPPRRNPAKDIRPHKTNRNI